MTIGRVKTLVLSCLVLLSLVFSVLLYRGGWDENTEVGMANVHTLPMSTHPTTREALSPYQIVFTDHQSQTMATPGSHLYQMLMDSLSSSHFDAVHRVTEIPKSNSFIRVYFGSPISNHELLNFIPSLKLLRIPPVIQQLTLFSDEASRKIECLFLSSTDWYLAGTDISTTAFNAWQKAAKKLPQWTEWSTGSGEFIPTNSVKVLESDWKVENPSLLPFIHSFFVNPQAITKIQTSHDSAIWTDGNRAVRVDANPPVLTYENPNTLMEPGSSQSDATLAILYIRSHGGCQSPSRLFQSNDTSIDTESNDYELHLMYQGYPIIGRIGTYEVSVEKGRVIRFRRPVQVLEQEISHREVTVFGAKRLREVIRKLAPDTPIDSLSVEFGYMAIPFATGTVRLIPIYTVSHQGIMIWTINAVTGQVTQGMDGT
jgi:regulatory protein YycH of two-component signal transduction system YycFG